MVFGSKYQASADYCFKDINNISTAKYQTSFSMLCVLVLSVICLNILLVFDCVLYNSCQTAQIWSKMTFLSFSLFLRPFSVTIALVKAK